MPGPPGARRGHVRDPSLHTCPHVAVAPSGSSEDRGLEPPEDALIVAGTRLADLRAEST